MRTISSVLFETRKNHDSKFYTDFIEKFPTRKVYEEEFLKFMNDPDGDFEEHFSIKSENNFLFSTFETYKDVTYNQFVDFIDPLINSEWT